MILAGSTLAARAAAAFKTFSASFFAEAARRRRPALRGTEPGSDLEYQVQIGFWEYNERNGHHQPSRASRDVCEPATARSFVGAPEVCPGGQWHLVSFLCRPWGTGLNPPCPKPGGTGHVSTQCPTCGGEGRVRRTETIDAGIFAGVRTGSRGCYHGNFGAGTNGMPLGRAPYSFTRGEPHPYFEGGGDDLYTAVPITVTEAALVQKDRSAHDQTVASAAAFLRERVQRAENRGWEKRVCRLRTATRVNAAISLRNVAGGGAQTGGRARADLCCANWRNSKWKTRAATYSLAQPPSDRGEPPCLPRSPRKKSRAGYMISAVSELYKLHPRRCGALRTRRPALAVAPGRQHAPLYRQGGKSSK